uniref:50S ribosomal protein L16, chloroplastic n=1 Tax=Oryza glumipatula TaxID=40148 RepID=A0A0D9YV61_9ORYZ
MGSGKGSTKYWVAVVKPGRILYEMGGVSETVARAAISIAASKMPIRNNGGARKLMCIQVIGAASNQRYARIGDVIGLFDRVVL